MPFVWNQDENSAAQIYEDVERHSPGMISFTYKPPSSEVLEKLKKTQTYRLFDGDVAPGAADESASTDAA